MGSNPTPSAYKPAGRAGSGLIRKGLSLLGPSWELTEMTWAEHLAWDLDHGKSSVTVGSFGERGVWERVTTAPILQMKEEKTHGLSRWLMSTASADPPLILPL